MNDEYDPQSYEEDIERLKTLIGKKIRALDYYISEGYTLSLTAIIFEDGSSLELAASDDCDCNYNALVMIRVSEATGDRFFIIKDGEAAIRLQANEADDNG